MQGRSVLSALLWAMLLVALLLGDGYRAQAQETTGQKVFIVVLDGARYTETFGDPLHRYIPQIWNLLRPAGTISTCYYNRGQTVTSGAGATLLTGNDMWLKQGYERLPRPFTPTLFEYYRAATGAPMSATWEVANHTRFLEGLTYSLHPSFGAPYGASWYFGPGSDYEMWQNLSLIMDQQHPDLVFVDFHEIDKYAHEGDWNLYTRHILIADRIVYELWRKIQRHPYYQGRTTLFVTNDHGRHTTDWTRHGDWCEGCQHVMFLALGPGIRKGYEVKAIEREHMDLAATAGWLLGVPMPYAIDGEVMTELFVTPPQVVAPEPPEETLLVTVTTTGGNGLPRDAFLPGETIGVQVEVSNAGLTTASIYQAVISLGPSRLGKSFDSAPVTLPPGGRFYQEVSVPLPRLMAPQQLDLSASVRGLGEMGELVLGSATFTVTITAPPS